MDSIKKSRTDFVSLSPERKKSIQKELSRKLSSRVSLSRKKDAPYEVHFPKLKHLKKANYIRTTKTTLLTFIPMNLYFQFGRLYNLYFLLGALAVFAGYSSFSWTSQVAPLLVVLAFSAAKEAVEEFNRYRADKSANLTPSTIVEDGKKKWIESQDLQPGDIVYMEKGSKFQVDTIILSSSYEDGTVFIETAELDGETNLKRKSTVPLTTSFRTDAEICAIKGQIQCEHPNENLVSFEGRLSLNEGDRAPVAPLSMLNMIPRGSVLRNTEHVYCMVVYVGSNTKIMKNLKQGKLKSSSLEKRLNSLVAAAFGYNMIILAASIIIDYFQFRNAMSKEVAMKATGAQSYATEWYHIWAQTVGFFTLYTYVIPISLFVTMELVRLGQATYMTKDPKMKYKIENTDGSFTIAPMRANNSNLNEDLGCVDYIFSDKTGTLTQNSMKMAKWFLSDYILDEMRTPGVVYKHIEDPNVPHEARENMKLFLQALSICHGVIPAVDEKTQKMIYESQSPDETALLIASEQNNYKLWNRTKKSMTIRINEVDQVFEVLSTIEFNSTRKRMSVIVRTPKGIHLYCKGADNIMLARLSNTKNDQAVIERANKALEDFSNVGLRTLMIGYKTLTEEEYENFRKVYTEAEISLDDRENQMDQASDLVENGLTMLGCTAIEDRLQDLVPETIENLLKADIKLWLLTGDKQETAINIGISSRLINRTMDMMILKADDPKHAEKTMDEMISKMKNGSPNQVYALIVNGNILSYVFAGGKDSKAKFLEIGTRCKTVICSRVTPLQKALVVRLVRNALKGSITLAIGDGANDVTMIQEAHIGIGIMGKEGTQAVRAADFAFGEFRFLERLLTVHGRFNYLRLSNLILYSFYKNFVFITVQFYFGFTNDWSGTLCYEEIFFSSFNVFFTFIPPLVYALYERDLPESMIEKYPELYREVKNGLYWNKFIIGQWFFTAMAHSLIIFGTIYLLNNGAIDVGGRSTGYWVQCYLLSAPMLLVVLSKTGIISKLWIWFVVFGLLISFGLNVLLMTCLYLLSSFYYSDPQTSVITHALPAYYLLCILLPALCILPDLVGD
ncbi:hypothetical protein BC833DRAFT_525617 [Globomyces pollinis-pini]|nr:hypothetical protein BC833DRAFT_525617 [Globomyces pollinis-pini]